MVQSIRIELTNNCLVASYSNHYMMQSSQILLNDMHSTQKKKKKSITLKICDERIGQL